jgi:tetratricopeptide (TPR) repeat protein
LLLACAILSCSDTPQRPDEQVQTPQDLHSAERAFLEARLDEAIDLLTVEKRDSTDGLLLAYSLFLVGDKSKGKRVFEETMAAPRYEREHLFRALRSITTGRLTEGIDFLELERRQAPRQFFANALYVEALILASRFDRAETTLNELLRRYPQETIVHHVLGHLESARESWQAAIDAYERARETGGENPDLDEGIASALIELQEFDAAAKVIERCKGNFPDYTEILFQEIRHSARNPRSTPESLDPLIADYERRTRRIDRLVEVAQIAEAQRGNAPAR